MSSRSRGDLDNIMPVLLGSLPEYISQVLSSGLSRSAEDLRPHGCLSSSVWKGDRRRFDTIAWLIGISSTIGHIDSFLEAYPQVRGRVRMWIVDRCWGRYGPKAGHILTEKSGHYAST